MLTHRKAHVRSISCASCSSLSYQILWISRLTRSDAQEYTGETGMRHVLLAAWGGSINRRSAEGSERVSGMEDLDLARGPQAFWGLSHLRESRPDLGSAADPGRARSTAARRPVSSLSDLDPARVGCARAATASPGSEFACASALAPWDARDRATVSVELATGITGARAARRATGADPRPKTSRGVSSHVHHAFDDVGRSGHLRPVGGRARRDGARPKGLVDRARLHARPARIPSTRSRGSCARAKITERGRRGRLRADATSRSRRAGRSSRPTSSSRSTSAATSARPSASAA